MKQLFKNTIEANKTDGLFNTYNFIILVIVAKIAWLAPLLIASEGF